MTIDTAARGPMLPVFMDLAGARVVVSGAGPRALEAALRFADLGARVRLVAADLAEAREQLADRESVELVEEAPGAVHAEGALLVACASDPPANDDALRAAAEARPALVVALTGGASHASLGAALCEGPFVLGLTSRGRSPELETALVRQAKGGIRPEHGRLADVLGGLRDRLEERFPDIGRRQLIWEQLLDESSPVLAMLQAGDEDSALELAERMAWGTG